MPSPLNISPAIIEALYTEALLLADEARATFLLAQAPRAASPAPLSAPIDPAPFAGAGEEETPARVALSCEALRTTTRMMHAIAWLLNHRAHFAGDLSEFQLRRHGRLPAPQPAGDPAQTALLDEQTRDLVTRTKAFYERIARIDRAWQKEGCGAAPGALLRLREQVKQAFPARG